MNEKGSLEVWDLQSDVVRYDELLGECLHTTPYHYTSYLLAEECAESYPMKIVVYRNGSSFVMMSGIIRRVNDLPYMKELKEEYYDFIAPHEYAGIIGNTENEKLYVEFLKAFDKYCSNNKIVYQFYRLNPYMKQEKIFVCAGYDVIHSNNQVYVDVENKSEEDLRGGYKSSAKYEINRTIKKGLHYEIVEKTENNILKFFEIYTRAMQYLQAQRFLYFNMEYFKMLITGECVDILFVTNGKDVMAGTVILYDYENKIVYYHLSCFDRDCGINGLSDLLVHGILVSAAQKGFKIVHLSAGRESLAWFKGKFSDKRIDYYIANKVSMSNEYEMLCDEWRKRCPEDADGVYYPLYRYSEE